MVDKVGSCVIVTIFHMSSSTAPLIGDSLAIPEPQYQITNVHCPKQVSVSLCMSVKLSVCLCFVCVCLFICLFVCLVMSIYTVSVSAY